MNTPPSLVCSRRGSVESLDDFDDDFYLANYVPLSSFPTPPEPTGHGMERKLSYEMPSNEQPEWRGPAIHLANLVPSSMSMHRASPLIIQTYLYRSALPLETVALAACILDSLSSRFERKLRKAFNEASVSSPPGPEIMVLTALALAHSAHADEHVRASHWTDAVASRAFSAPQFTTASRCILIDIDYALHSFTNLIEETIRDMDRIGQAVRPAPSTPSYFAISKPPHQRVDSMLQGSAIEANGLMTPDATPS